MYDGAPSQNLYACDLKGEFLDLGYELFKDKETLKSHGFVADVFAPSSALDELNGKIDAVYAADFIRTCHSELILRLRHRACLERT